MTQSTARPVLEFPSAEMITGVGARYTDFFAHPVGLFKEER